VLSRSAEPVKRPRRSFCAALAPSAGRLPLLFLRPNVCRDNEFRDGLFLISFCS
jgi:hypothetical protein